MSKISVIIPVYNDEAFIVKCLDSVCSQTIASELEIIIVDDGSTDGSVALAKETLERHSMMKQAKLILLGENHGVANARKLAIEAAVGEYVMSCDSDDWMEPRMCELMLRKAEEERCDLVVCDYNSINGDKVEKIGQCYKDNFLQQLILCQVTGSLWNKLIRTSLMKRPDFIYPDHDFSEDHAYCVQLAILAAKIGYVPLPLYNYSKRSDSVVRSTAPGKLQKRYDDDMANFALEISVLNNSGLMDEYREEIIIRKLKTKNGYRQNRVMWLNTFPELGKEIFRSSFVSWRSRVAYMIRLLGLK